MRNIKHLDTPNLVIVVVVVFATKKERVCKASEIKKKQQKGEKKEIEDKPIKLKDKQKKNEKKE